MSVVVRMEMPKSCPCELAGGYDIPLPCFAGHGIPKRCKEFDECVENGAKPDWCPFVCQLPEGHGQLIDLETAAEGLSERYNSCHMTCGAVMQFLDGLPAIVPAEAERSEHE